MKWRKASRSGGNGGACVELREDLGALRDSKHPTGPTLRVPVGPLVAAVKSGRIG